MKNLLTYLVPNQDTNHFDPSTIQPNHLNNYDDIHIPFVSYTRQDEYDCYVCLRQTMQLIDLNICSKVSKLTHLQWLVTYFHDGILANLQDYT
jgi:hypothetical protein